MKDTRAADRRLAQENYEYYQSSQWSSWIGPRIPPSEPHAAEKMQEVERIFQSVNLIHECVDRHVNALIGQFPMWHLKGADGERAEAPEAELQLQRWIDAVLQRSDSGTTDQNDPFFQSVLDLSITGTAALRLWQPSRFAEAQDPIDRIHLHACKLGSVTETRDLDGFREKLTYAHAQGAEELTLDGDLLTIATKDEELTLDTGGRWTIATMRSPSLITPQIKQNQNAVNHAATMMMRNQEQAGFLERIFLNAQSPGEWVDDPTAPGGQKFIPSGEGLDRGPGRDTFLYGIPQGDQNNPGYTSPSVIMRDPISPITFIESIRTFRGFIYHAFGQGHLLQEGDGSISGVSRIQLRQDFEIALMRQKRTIESAIANIFNIVLRLLGYPELTAVVQLRTTTGKLAPEERAAIIAEYQAGLLSKATTIARLGTVEDVDSELAMIVEESEEAMQRRPTADPFELGENDGANARNDTDDRGRDDSAPAAA